MRIPKVAVFAVVCLLLAAGTPQAQEWPPQKPTVDRGQVLAEIAAGRLDPLDWYRKQSDTLALPSTVIYAPACSRDVTAAANFPSAVLSFGVPASSAWLRVLRARGVNVPEVESGQQAPRATMGRPEPNPDVIVSQTRRFYAGKNYSAQGEPSPFQWVFTSPDSVSTVTVFGVNTLVGIPACRALASGPMVVVKPGPKSPIPQ